MKQALIYICLLCVSLNPTYTRTCKRAAWFAGPLKYHTSMFITELYLNTSYKIMQRRWDFGKRSPKFLKFWFEEVKRCSLSNQISLSDSIFNKMQTDVAVLDFFDFCPIQVMTHVGLKHVRFKWWQYRNQKRNENWKTPNIKCQLSASLCHPRLNFWKTTPFMSQIPWRRSALPTTCYYLCIWHQTGHIWQMGESNNDYSGRHVHLLMASVQKEKRRKIKSEISQNKLFIKKCSISKFQ